MARKEHTAQVAGRNYRIHAFASTEGLELGMELARIAAPVLATLLALKDDGDELSPEVAEKIAKTVVEALEPKAAVRLIKRLLANTIVEKGDEDEPGAKLDSMFDQHFCGQLEVALMVAGEVVAFNFTGFFSGLAELMPGKKG